MQNEQAHLDADRLGEVQNLQPDSSGVIVIGPETSVLCVHRGREIYRDMFDSRTYSIAPGYFTAPYAAALHFKKRAVVPGTRNPETASETSFIAIIGVAVPTREGTMKIVKPVDDAVDWDPFTDDECREYGHAIEALDRSHMLDPIETSVSILPTRGQANEDAKAKSRLHGGGNQGGNHRKTRIEGSGKALLRPGQKGDDETGVRATLGHTGTNEAIDQTRVDAAAASQGGGN